MYIGAFVLGDDAEGRLLRRSIVRYLNFSFVLTMRMVSSAVLKRFPTMEHLVEAGDFHGWLTEWMSKQKKLKGYITHEELKLYDDINCKFSKQYVGCAWAATLLHKAKEAGRIQSNVVLLKLVEVFSLRRLVPAAQFHWLIELIWGSEQFPKQHIMDDCVSWKLSNLFNQGE